MFTYLVQFSHFKPVLPLILLVSCLSLLIWLILSIHLQPFSRRLDFFRLIKTFHLSSERLIREPAQAVFILGHSQHVFAGNIESFKLTDDKFDSLNK